MYVVCMAESLCCPPETITTLLMGYTLVQNKKFLKIKNNGGTDSLELFIYTIIILK